MAKHNCAICGAEVNLFTGQQLADKNHICRKVCAKKCLKLMDLVPATLDEVQSHIEQVERGTDVWNKLLAPMVKTKVKEEKMKRFGQNGSLYVSPYTGLIALVETRYKIFIFGKSEHACVYRIADLYEYEYENEVVKTSDGKDETKHYCRLLFNNTAGLYDVRLPIRSSAEHKDMEKYFDTLFGIQRTLGNIKNTFRQQMNAAKAVKQAIGTIHDNTIDQNAAQQAMDALETAQYGDRAPWIEKADTFLAKVSE